MKTMWDQYYRLEKYLNAVTANPEAECELQPQDWLEILPRLQEKFQGLKTELATIRVQNPHYEEVLKETGSALSDFLFLNLKAVKDLGCVVYTQEGPVTYPVRYV